MKDFLKTLSAALTWLTANQDALIVILGALAALLGGKAKKAVIVTSDVLTAVKTIRSGSQSHNSVVTELPSKSSLSLEQVKDIIKPTTNGVKIEAVPLVMAVASSGDGRKITAKIKKWFKKL